MLINAPRKKKLSETCPELYRHLNRANNVAAMPGFTLGFATETQQLPNQAPKRVIMLHSIMCTTAILVALLSSAPSTVYWAELSQLPLLHNAAENSPLILTQKMTSPA